MPKRSVYPCAKRTYVVCIKRICVPKEPMYLYTKSIHLPKGPMCQKYLCSKRTYVPIQQKDLFTKWTKGVPWMFFRLLLIIRHCSDQLEALRFADVRNIDSACIDFDVSTLQTSLSNVKRFEFATSDEMSPKTIQNIFGMMKCLEAVSFRDRSGIIPMQNFFVSLQQIIPGHFPIAWEAGEVGQSWWGC